MFSVYPSKVNIKLRNIANRADVSTTLAIHPNTRPRTRRPSTMLRRDALFPFPWKNRRQRQDAQNRDTENTGLFQAGWVAVIAVPNMDQMGFRTLFCYLYKTKDGIKMNKTLLIILNCLYMILLLKYH